MGMISVGTVSTFATGPQGSSKPDSITTADGSLTTSNGSFFVEYGNGADTTGAGGSSTIVQYYKAGNIEHSYTIPGSVDGLKFNPFTGQIWALQNQDGNSTLTLIDPITHTVSTPLSFANPSATRGYDDVVFEGDKVFLSYTNPNGAGDPTLVELINGDRPTGVLLTTTILADGATGFNTVKGKTEVIPQTDPDSLKLAPNDVIKPGATASTFYLTDTAANEVYSFHATGLNTDDARRLATGVMDILESLASSQQGAGFMGGGGLGRSVSNRFLISF
jgi:hypothetical protein